VNAELGGRLRQVAVGGRERGLALGPALAQLRVAGGGHAVSGGRCPPGGAAGLASPSTVAEVGDDSDPNVCSPGVWRGGVVVEIACVAVSQALTWLSWPAGPMVRRTGSDGGLEGSARSVHSGPGMSARGALVLLACLLLTGCPDGEKADGTDTDDSTAEAGDSEPTTGDPACACIDAANEDFFSYVCEPPPCGTVALKCGDSYENLDPLCNNNAEVVSFDEAALDCSLDRLIARMPGIVEYHVLYGDYGGSYGGGFVDASTGLMRTYSGAFAHTSESAAGFVTLKDPAYFAGCKAEADVAARYKCFRQWSVEEEPTAQCDEPMEYYNEF